MHNFLAVALLFVCPVSLLGQKSYSTSPVECSELKKGETVRYKTAVRTSAKDNVRVYASITLHRDRADDEGKSCVATYRLFVGNDTGDAHLVKAFSEKQEELVGVDVVGFSPDKTKVAADFWWAAGDYTGHRPVIYDFKTNRALFRELEGQITGQLPSCDYFQLFNGISNAGEAIIHVAKSDYVDEGCPDQGDWLFNLKTGTVSRKR